MPRYRKPLSAEADWKRRVQAQTERDALRRELEAARREVLAARLERQQGLACDRVRCQRARERLREVCAMARARTRARARTKIEEATGKARTSRADYAAEQRRKRAHEAAGARGRRAIDRIRESDDAVRAEVEAERPDLLELWERNKRHIRARRGMSRVEAFWQFAHDQGMGEKKGYDDGPTDDELAAELAEWARREGYAA